MPVNEVMQNALDTVIKNLIRERNDLMQLIRDSDATIEILRKKYDTLVAKDVLSVNGAKAVKIKPEKKKVRRAVSQGNCIHQIIEKMYQEETDIITPKWVMIKCTCNYHAATKRLGKAIKQELLTRKDKGVYEMRHGLRQEITDMIKNSPEKVDVQKLVELCMSRVKEPPKQVIAIPTSISKLPEIPDKMQSAGEVARAILREANRPMHGVIELYPMLVKRGVSIRPNSVGKILSNFNGIKRTAPNTWAIDDTPVTESVSSDQDANATAI